jgi:DNA-binding NarL/FixJ family response regulator
MATMRIILADDHELVRAGIRPFLRDLGPEVEVVEADTFDQAMTALAEAGPSDLAIIDLRMPGMRPGWLAAVRRQGADLPVVVLSGSLAPEDVVQSLRDGAAGYIPKTFGGPALVAALKLVLSGQRFFPAFALEALLNDVPAAGGGSRGGAAGEGAVLEKLSARERDILGLMIQGGTNKEIARQLEVQEITVKVHLRNIYRKLGAANRAQAVRIALENGWRTRP